MAKISGISGTLAGKVGNIVYSVVKGVNTARQYNPAPFNPNTPSQVEVRAKLKLISQLSAVVAAQVAVVTSGVISARNKFVSMNYKFLHYVNDAVEMSIADMQLTGSSTGFVGFRVERVPNYGLSVTLDQNAFPAWDKVVWIVYKVLSDGKLMFNESKVVDLTAEGPLGATIMQDVPGDCSIHCYGISTKTAKAVAMFEDMAIVTADEVARLITSRAVSESDVALSETRGLYFGAGESEDATTGAAIRIQLRFDPNSAVQTGALVGAGTYAPGTIVHISAPEVAGYTFDGWWSSKLQSFISRAREFDLTVGTSPDVLSANYNVTQ